LNRKKKTKKMKAIKEKIRDEIEQLDGLMKEKYHDDISMNDLEMIHKLIETYYHLCEIEHLEKSRDENMKIPNPQRVEY